MKTIYKAALIASVTTLAAMTVHAHHSFAMFDRTTEVVKTGTVQRWAFNNPHSWLYVNVTNEDGTQTLWSFELEGGGVVERLPIPDRRGTAAEEVVKPKAPLAEPKREDESE